LNANPWVDYVDPDAVAAEFPSDVHALVGRRLPFRPLISCNLQFDAVHEVHEDTDFVLPDSLVSPEERAEILSDFERRVGKSIWDGPTRRLNGARLDGGVLRLELGRSSFFKTVVTNFAPALRRYAHLRERIDPGPKLSPLRESRASSHIGVSVMLLLPSENRVVLARRSNVIVYDGMWAPAACGAVDGHCSVTESAVAELKEEIGVPQEAVSSWRVIGVARDPVRMGEPEFFALATTHDSITPDDVRAWWRGARDSEESSEIDFVESESNVLREVAARRDSSPMLWAAVWFYLLHQRVEDENA
jgi:8-oxo-dGTP pyrophosphatase MutT (NUDIX family)